MGRPTVEQAMSYQMHSQHSVWLNLCWPRLGYLLVDAIFVRSYIEIRVFFFLTCYFTEYLTKNYHISWNRAYKLSLYKFVPKTITFLLIFP